MNLDFSSITKSFPKIRRHHPLDELAQETATESDQLVQLQQKLDQQRNQVEQLMKIVSSPRDQIQSTNDRYYKVPQAEQLNIQLLEEIKNLKRQIQNIENGPRAPQVPFMPPFLPQQQYQVPPYYMNYPVYGNPQYQQYNPYQYQIPPQDQPYNRQYLEQIQQIKKTEQQLEIKKAIVELLKNGQIESSKDKRKQKPRVHKQSHRYLQNQQSEEDEDSEQYFSSGFPTSNNNRRGKASQSQSELVSMRQLKHSTKKTQEKKQSVSQSLRQLTVPPVKVRITPEKLKMLKKKLQCLTKWIIFFYRKHWDKKEQLFMQIFNEQIGMYDSDFHFEQSIATFFQEAEKKKLFKSSWIITEKKDIQNRSIHLILICQTLLTTVITGVKSAQMSEQHKQYINSFTTSGGYLFTGHSAFVAQRLQLKYNRSLIFTSDDQRKMALMEYVYISTFVMVRVFGADQWAKVLQNNKEGLKLLISFLSHLFVDKFKSLLVLSKGIRYNSEAVFFCDFNQQNFQDIGQTINPQDPRYQITDKCPILGLYDETVLEPVLQQPTYAKCKGLFQDFCDMMFSKV